LQERPYKLTPLRYLFPKAVGYMLFGIIYTAYNLKFTFMASISFAVLGSLTSAVAQSSTVLIVGRAISGLGAAGIFPGVMVILDNITSPSNKPRLLALLGLVSAIAFVTGPLIAGAIIDKLLWRWIFYINIPIGGVVILTVMVFFTAPKALKTSPKQYGGRIYYILATLFLIASVIIALLAINGGGRKYLSTITPSIWILVAVFIIAIVFSLLNFFVAYINSLKDRWQFIVPLRIFKDRSLISGIIFAAPISSGFWVLLYYVRSSLN
jgi:MFS family permease